MRTLLIRLCLSLLTLSTFAEGPSPSPTNLLNHFRSAGIAGDFAFHFNLSHFPKSAPEVVYQGYMHGTWSAQGPVYRVYLKQLRSENPLERSVLVRGGPSPQAWIFDGQQATQLSETELHHPIFPNTNFSVFDLVLGYAYWPNAEFIGENRAKGRQAYEFLLKPNQKQSDTQATHASLFLDQEFSVMLKCTVSGTSAQKLKTYEVIDFKKTQGQYIVKTFDVFDEITRERSRFRIAGAALNLTFPETEFIPDSLNQPFTPLEEKKFTFF